jgi:hypothetical protein
MPGRDERIYQEAAALWRELYDDEPPPCGGDGKAILDMITRRLPDSDYGKLSSPHIRPSTVVFPKDR